MFRYYLTRGIAVELSRMGHTDLTTELPIKIQNFIEICKVRNF